MPLPPNVGFGIVTGKIIDSNGDTASGKVLFTPSPKKILNVTATPPVIILPKAVETNLQGDGTFSQQLVATNDLQNNPVDWTYKVSFNLNDASMEPFAIEVPEGQEVDLAVVAPVSSSGGVLITRGEGVPEGGTDGQVLVRVGSDDTGWETLNAGSVDDHLNDGTDAHDASAISFTPGGSIAATNVQAAIEEVAAEAGGAAPVDSVNGQTGVVVLDATDVGAETPAGAQSKADTAETNAETTAAAALSAHETDTTGVHGIADTNDIILEGDSRLSNDRTPTPHAASHATGQSDAITPASIGAATDAAFNSHLSDASDAHDASAISFVPSGTIAATNVQAAIEEVAAEAGGGGGSVDSVNGQTGAVVLDAADVGAETPAGAQAKVDTHTGDATAAHAASAISFVPSGTLASTNIQDVIEELRVESETPAGAQAKANTAESNAEATADAALSAHSSDTTGIHGITNTADLETESGAQSKADTAQSNAEATAAGALSAHESDATDAHDASAISFAPAGTIASTNVQAAIEELMNEAAGAAPVDSVNGQTGVVVLDAGDVGAETPAGAQSKADTAESNAETTAADALALHEADTTDIHGIADTSLLETQSGAQSKADTAESNAEATAAGALSAHEADTLGVHGIADTSVLEVTSNKGAANGYAPLDASSLVPVEHVPDVQGPKGDTGPPGPVGNSVSAILDPSETYNLNPANATQYSLTMTGPATLTQSGLTGGAGILVTVIQDGTGGHTLTVPSSWVGSASLVLTETANEFDQLVIWQVPDLGVCVKRVLTGPLPAGLWTPLQIPSGDRAFWHRADSLSLEEEDPVTSWADEYGIDDYTTVEGSPTLKILNGIKYVEFDGSDALLSAGPAVGTANPYTLALLVRVNAAGTQPIFDDQNNLSGFDVYAADDPQNYRAGAADANTLTTNGVFQVLLIGYVNGPTGWMRCDGVEETVNPGGKDITTSGKILGKAVTGAYGTVDVAEKFGFAGLPDAQTLADMETYLSDRRDALNGV